VLAVICSKTGRSAEIFAAARPSAIPFALIGAAALNSTAVLLCPLGQSVGTLVDLFAFLRYQVSDRGHTLLSRFLHVRQVLL
jgi:hypothetical protein